MRKKDHMLLAAGALRNILALYPVGLLTVWDKS